MGEINGVSEIASPTFLECAGNIETEIQVPSPTVKTDTSRPATIIFGRNPTQNQSPDVALAYDVAVKLVSQNNQSMSRLALEFTVYPNGGIKLTNHNRAGMAFRLKSSEPWSSIDQVQIFSSDTDFRNLEIAFNGWRIQALATGTHPEIANQAFLKSLKVVPPTL